jgi:cellulose synthase/poly-beta-1,6-N-acetylglucosamine synthase-like glycosyltransferase
MAVPDARQGTVPKDRLILVVPCFNEAERLDASTFRHWVASRPNTHVWFVDDGSSDATLARLEALRREVPDQVSVLRLEVNVGKGEAVRSGIRHALEAFPEFNGFSDADLATSLTEVDALMHEFEVFPSAEMVFAARVQLMGDQSSDVPGATTLGACSQRWFPACCGCLSTTRSAVPRSSETPLSSIVSRDPLSLRAGSSMWR